MFESDLVEDMAPFEISIAALERRELARLAAAFLVACIASTIAAGAMQRFATDGATILSYLALCASALLAAVGFVIGLAAASPRRPEKVIDGRGGMRPPSLGRAGGREW